MEKIYTQEDMDNITSKVKESQKAKYEKTHISLETYQELQSKYDALVEENKINGFKETFIANGGNGDAYKDFISNNKDLLEMNEKDLNNRFVELKQAKPYYFGTQAPSEMGTNINQTKELEDLMGEDDRKPLNNAWIITK